MWLIRPTPRLSRRRANSVCGSRQSWTRSCIARMTSALLRSWSVMNCRDPTATPSVMSNISDCRGFGQAPHVADSPLGWRCLQVVHVVSDCCFQWVPLRSDSGVGDVECLQGRRHQDRATHNVTIVHVPLICQALRFSATQAAGRGHP